MVESPVGPASCRLLAAPAARRCSLNARAVRALGWVLSGEESPYPDPFPKDGEGESPVGCCERSEAHSSRSGESLDPAFRGTVPAGYRTLRRLDLCSRLDRHAGQRPADGSVTGHRADFGTGPDEAHFPAWDATRLNATLYYPSLTRLRNTCPWGLCTSRRGFPDGTCRCRSRIPFLRCLQACTNPQCVRPRLLRRCRVAQT